MIPYDQYPPAPHIEDILRDWISYYQATRGVGHTHAALHGAHSVEQAKLVVHATVMSKTLMREFKGHDRTVLYARTERLRGLNLPVVWDNCALIDLFIRSARRIEGLKTEIEELKRANEQLTENLLSAHNLYVGLQRKITKARRWFRRLLSRS
jgi:hypothetical protein